MRKRTPKRAPLTIPMNVIMSEQVVPLTVRIVIAIKAARASIALKMRLIIIALFENYFGI